MTHHRNELQALLYHGIEDLCTKADGVGLLRAEHLMLSIGKHPRLLLEEGGDQVMVDTFALISCQISGLLTREVMTLSLGFMLPLAVGIGIGNFLFHRFHNEEAFRKQVIILLMCLAVASFVKFTIFP